MTRRSPENTDLAVRGACFGYEVRSKLSLSFLRSGPGDPMEVVSEVTHGPRPDERLLIEWTPHGGHRLHARLYRGGHVYRLWVAGAGWFSVDPTGPRIAVPSNLALVRCQELLWAIPAALCLLHRGDLPLHGAAVQVDGGAVVLAAPGGFGKTTLAASFYEAGHGVLSEDLTCLRADPGPMVVPGPAMLRLRSDVDARLSMRNVRAAAATRGRTTLALLAPRPSDGAPVPLRGIIFLRRSAETVRLTRVPAERAIRDLWALTFQIPGDSDRARCFGTIVDLVRQVPVWNLQRPLRFGALPATMKRIVDAAVTHE